MSSNIKYHLFLDVQDSSSRVCSCPQYKTIKKHFFYVDVQLGGFQFSFSLVSTELDVLLGIKITYFNYKDKTLGKMNGGWLGQFPFSTAFHLHSK